MKLVFDIGGTHTRIARAEVSAEGVPALGVRVEYETPQNFSEAIQKMSKGLADIAGGEKPSAVAGCFPGKTDPKSGAITYAPHIQDWLGKSFSKELIAAWTFGPDTPLCIENDATLAALAEARLGAGQGHDIVAFVTVSTGIGGARIFRGQIDVSKDGFEPGHQIIDWKSGATLEDLVSGSGIKSHYGMEIQKITDQAQREEAAKILAAGIHNMIVHWSPDIMILGGPVIAVPPGIDLALVQKYVAETLHFKTVPPIILSRLYPDAGLIGAAIFAPNK